MVIMEKNIFKELGKVLIQFEQNGFLKTERKINMIKVNYEKNGLKIDPEFKKMIKRLSK